MLLSQQDKAPAMTADQFKSELIRILPQLQRFAVSLTRSRPEADHLLRDACATALQHWRTYDPALQFDRWLFSIARNCWDSGLRKHVVGVSDKQEPTDHDVARQTSTPVDKALAARPIHRTASGLEHDLSLPLMLVCAEGYSYCEVSQMLNIPIGTVKHRIHRARKSLLAHCKK